MAGELGEKLLSECERMSLDQLLLKLHPPSFLPFTGIPNLDSIISSSLSTSLSPPPLIEILSPIDSSTLRTTLISHIASTALLDGSSSVLLISCSPGGIDLLQLREFLKSSILSLDTTSPNLGILNPTSTSTEGSTTSLAIAALTTLATIQRATAIASSLLDHLHIYNATTIPHLLSILASAPSYLLSSNHNSQHRLLGTIILDSPDIPLTLHLSTFSSTPSAARELAGKVNADVVEAVLRLGRAVGAGSVVVVGGGRVRREMGEEERIMGGVGGVGRYGGVRVWVEGKEGAVEGWVVGRTGEKVGFGGRVEGGRVLVEGG